MMIRHYRDDLDGPGAFIVTGTEMTFLGTDAADALRSAPYPWADLVGLYVAPDLVPVVTTVLAGRGRTLDHWMHGELNQEAWRWTCRYVWRDCTMFGEVPLTAFWVTARPEVVRAVIGTLSETQLIGMEQNPGEPVGLLVDRHGRVLLTETYFYPYSQMWNVSPFEERSPFTFRTLSDLRNQH